MSQPLNPMTHGLNGLVVAYAVVLIPIILGLRQGRAPGDALWRAPIWAIPITLVAGIVVSLVSSPLRTLGMDKEGAFGIRFEAHRAARGDAYHAIQNASGRGMESVYDDE